jgi:hypothetical protein
MKAWYQAVFRGDWVGIKEQAVLDDRATKNPALAGFLGTTVDHDS